MSSFGSKKATVDISSFGKLAVGGLSSCTAVSICHPFDVLKVRMQMDGLGVKLAEKSGVFGMMTKVVRNEGILALTKGLSAAITRQLVYSSIRYGSYPILKNMLSKEGEYLPLHLKVIASGLSGAVGSFIGSPNDLMLVRMQGGKSGYRNVFDGMFKTVKSDGVLGLWRGCIPTVVRGCFVTIGQIASYDQLKQIMLTKFGRFFADNLTTHLIASSLAGIIATAITNPVDVIKTRIMSMQPNSTGVMPYKGVMDCAVKVMKEEGFAAFYKGFLPAASRLVPVTILTFVFYEKYYNLFVWLFHKNKRQ